MKKKDKIKIDAEVAGMLAKELVKPFAKAPAEDSLTILNAFAVAIIAIAKETKNECTSNVPDALEKLILTWLGSCDSFTGMNFSKYINLPDEKQKYYSITNNDIAS